MLKLYNFPQILDAARRFWPELSKYILRSRIQKTNIGGAFAVGGKVAYSPSQANSILESLRHERIETLTAIAEGATAEAADAEDLANADCDRVAARFAGIMLAQLENPARFQQRYFLKD